VFERVINLMRFVRQNLKKNLY